MLAYLNRVRQAVFANSRCINFSLIIFICTNQWRQIDYFCTCAIFGMININFSFACNLLLAGQLRLIVYQQLTIGVFNYFWANGRNAIIFRSAAAAAIPATAIFIIAPVTANAVGANKFNFRWPFRFYILARFTIGSVFIKQIRCAGLINT